MLCIPIRCHKGKGKGVYYEYRMPCTPTRGSPMGASPIPPTPAVTPITPGQAPLLRMGPERTPKGYRTITIPNTPPNRLSRRVENREWTGGRAGGLYQRDDITSVVQTIISCLFLWMMLTDDIRKSETLLKTYTFH